MAPTDTGEYIPLETLNANGEDNYNEVEGEQPHRKRTNIWHRLGTTSVLIVSLGCPLILLAVTLLALFWYYSMRAMDGQEPEIYWVHIIYANWATRLVTVCTTVIRTVVASQVGLTTAMVASIILETTGVPFLLGPFYSMLRAFKVAPINLWTATNFQPYMSRFIYALMLTEVLVTVASQFLSTIFLSDFGNAAFTQRSKKTNIKLLETEGFVNNVWWFVPPAASWTFAELSESFETRPGFHDTGHTFRAFLPFEEEAQRSKLRRFKGPVPIMNHRVVCASPSLINLSLDTTWQSYVTLSGQIPTKDLTYPLLIDPASQRFINFSCKLPTVSLARNNTVGETSICAPYSLSEWAFLDQEPLDKAFAKGMKLFIILDIVSALALWEITGNITTVQTIRTDGPWTITSNGSAHIETVRVSACLTSLATQTFTVEMNSTSDNLEPKATWNHRTKRYNTEHSRLQLGVSSPGNTSSANHRGILTLGPRSQWEIIQPPASPYFFSAIMLGFPSLTRYGLGTRRIDPVVTLSSRSSNFYDGSAHPIHTDLFQDTLITTASPALALQVVLSRVYQMAYYEHLVKSNTQVASTSAFSVATTIPVQWTGFVLGTVLIAIHLIIVISVLGRFVKSTEISFIGCYWETVAQLVSSETRPVLEEADRMNDRAVGEWMKREAALGSDRWVLRGRTGKRITLGRSEDN